MTLLHASAEAQTRTLKRVGAIVVLLIVTATILYLVVDPSGRKSRDIVSVAIDTPYVGDGVAVGTPLIMHGVTVGQVVSVSSIPGGGVRLETDLQRGPTHELTDAMGIDYRPSNYFGVTGINVIPAQSGRPLRDGMQINVTPKGNFSLQALLYRLGELSNGVFNERLISVIERATRYVDGLNPLLETMLIVGTSVAAVQTVSSERLLRNATGVSVALPGMVSALISTGNDFLHSMQGIWSFSTGSVDGDREKMINSVRYYSEFDERFKRQFDDNLRLMLETKNTDEYYFRHFFSVGDASRTDLFSRVGYLLSSHIRDLSPVVESVRTLADAVPKIVSPESFAYTVTELRKRFERMYVGSGDQRALQVRIVLDRFPGIAAPLGLAMDGSS